jgi:GxxExxY protein
MDTDDGGRDRITQRIIGCAFEVSNEPGPGFLEKLYENALAHELRLAGLAVQQEHGITVRYKGVTIGEYTAGLLVEGSVLVELKAVRALDDIHRAQCLNYLKATGLRVCLLLNFARPRLEMKRFML